MENDHNFCVRFFPILPSKQGYVKRHEDSNGTKPKAVTYPGSELWHFFTFSTKLVATLDIETRQ